VAEYWPARLDHRLLIYMLALQVAISFGSPYFSPFMLRELDLSYPSYTLLLSASIFARILIFPVWGRLAHKHGPRVLLWIAAIGMVPSAGLWTLSQSLPFLFASQLITGVAWAAYELATQLLFFEMIRRHERIYLLTLFNLGNALAVAMGAGLGGLMLAGMGHSFEAYMVVFALSAALRLCTWFLLERVVGFGPAKGVAIITSSR
jgi:MFS family permease